MKHFATLAVGALFLSACGGGTSEAGGGDGDGAATEPLKICVVHNNADHPSVTAIVDGMTDEGKNYNADISYFDPAMDPQKQVAMLEDCLASNPDVIALNTVDPVAPIATVKRAAEAGIPVVTMNADVDDEGKQYREGFVGSESYDQGYAVGLMIDETLNGTGKIALITGNPGQTDAVNRTEGLKAAFADQNASIEIVAEQPGEWSRDTALTVMTDILTRTPDVDAVFGHDDPMALGALEAIKAADRDDIFVFGVNGNTEACERIESGEMAGTALQLSYLVGAYTVRAAFDLKNDRLINDEILAPTAPVTSENVAEWIDQCW